MEIEVGNKVKVLYDIEEIPKDTLCEIYEINEGWEFPITLKNVETGHVYRSLVIEEEIELVRE